MNETSPSLRCIIALPPRNDTEASVEEEWKLSFPDGVNFEGQNFVLPDGCFVRAAARWLETSLLSVDIFVDMKATAPCARCLKQTTLAISDDLRYLYYPFGLDFGKDTELRLVQ